MNKKLIYIADVLIIIYCALVIIVLGQNITPDITISRLFGGVMLFFLSLYGLIEYIYFRKWWWKQ